MIHIENLSKLLEWGGDYAPNRCEELRLTKRAIHHAHIMERRQIRPVTCRHGGTLADYVPFYFRPRSPMLYAIKGGQVEGYSGQNDIIYLQTSAERIASQCVPFAFTDGHALIAYAEFYDDLAQLDQVPWDAVRAQYWNDYNDGKFKCQAEFLVKDFCSLDLVDKIGVFDNATEFEVQKLVRKNNRNLIVSTERSWYF